MAILVTPQTRVLVQGITGSFGARHTQLSLDYGSQIVAGVTPARAASSSPIASPSSTPSQRPSLRPAPPSASSSCPALAADAILEAVGAGLDLVVAITEGIPVNDMVRVKAAMRGGGPASSGPIAPASSPWRGQGIPWRLPHRHLPGYIHRKGSIGVVSRSGTLTYEAVWQLTSRGYGQSTCVGIGGDPVNGTSHLDVLKMFNDDPETEAIIMIGEIGGTAEEEAAAWAKEHCKSPSPPSSPAPPPLPGAAWATPAPSFPAAKAPPPAKSRPSTRPASP